MQRVLELGIPCTQRGELLGGEAQRRIALGQERAHTIQALLVALALQLTAIERDKRVFVGLLAGGVGRARRFVRVIGFAGGLPRTLEDDPRPSVLARATL